MAIVVEEEKNRYSRLPALVSWMVIIAIIAVAAYYIFFKRPDIISISPPAELGEIEELLEIRIAPEEVVGSPSFQALKLYVSPLVPSTPGKANPFLSR